jgi:soluble lytic murein transglycosylase-like protein
MKTADIRSGGASPAFLPLRRSTGSEFSKQLRAQFLAELNSALAPERAPFNEPVAGTSRPAAYQPLAYQPVAYQSPVYQQPPISLPTPTGDAAYWFDLARSIGGQYLSPQAADVFARQMQLESAGFDPDVIAGRRVSSAGAEGIAQLMPSSYPHVNRRDPVASLHAGAQTMQANLQQFGGDIRKALAAYNAGGGRVAREVAQLGPIWESGLPDETKRYLAALLGGNHG